MRKRNLFFIWETTNVTFRPSRDPSRVPPLLTSRKVSHYEIIRKVRYIIQYGLLAFLF